MSRDFVRSLPQQGTLRAAAPLHGSLHADYWLLAGLLAVMAFGLMVLNSAVDQNQAVLNAQMLRLGLGLFVMFVTAQFHPRWFLRWAPVVYVGGVILCLAVPFFGVTVNGSQRWLKLPGLPQFQPSELMKIAVPMAVAWYLHDRPLPPSFKDLCVCLLIIAVPFGCIVLQPDLGTSLLVAGAGIAVILLAGIYWRWIFLALLGVAMAAPGLWYTLQEYQKQRILMLFDPESDPLGAGWNIIQSTTAIGSGGLWGKGLFQGTQSHLDFLPEARTDFIIAVVGEELGFMGILSLLALYLFVIGRGLYASALAPRTFDRLLSGALVVTFFVYVFVNIGMVSGLLPVVGVPLPLVSYGGTSAITLLAGFGVVMSVYSHRHW